MAELTTLEEKVAEVIGLAQAAQRATSKVADLPEGDGELSEALAGMGDEAAEAERRGTDVAAGLDGKKTAIEEKARETKSEATEMMDTYLGDDADALDGLEFLIMAEAGELGHVEIAAALAANGGPGAIRDYLAWVQPIQERHVQLTRDHALRLAAASDPEEAS